MNTLRVNLDDFAIDGRCLTAPLQTKLQAARDAGFEQMVLSASDLSTDPAGVDAAATAVLASGLRVTAFVALDDFEGLAGPLHDYKTRVAKSLLTLCQTVGCHTLLVNASSLPEASRDSAALCASLRQLAMLAIPKAIRIAYRAWAGAQVVRDFAQAWDLVCQADMPNLGLCLDLVETLLSGTPDNDLEMLDIDKLFLVQLADVISPARAQFQVFAGEANHSARLATLVRTLHELGYRGNYALNAANSDYQQLPADVVAQRAVASALWLGQEVLQRSVPLPNQIRLRRLSDRAA